MLQRSIEFPLSRPSADVLALFSNRSTGWLRGFLRLATHPAAARSAAYIDQRPWYRLAPPMEIAVGEYAARLIWWPHLDDRLFTSFRGDFRFVAGSTTTLSLVGQTDGGNPQHNALVMNRLLLLITSAIESGQDLVG